MKCTVIALGLFVCPSFCLPQGNKGLDSSLWKAGVATANITPEGSVWMGGFGFRNKPSEGITTDIWAKALALEDKNQRRAVMISIETSGVTKPIYEAIMAKLKSAYQLTNAQVIINSSHTHSSPAPALWFTRDEHERQKITRYIAKLVDQVVAITGKALQSLEPVRLYAENGVARFQVNRRTNIEYKLHLLSAFNGPNDYAVPVIKVEKQSGALLAVLFGYACHPSVLRDYNISGDYPSFAQIELERLYPGATAIFFQGAGGNQIGYPRRTVAAAKQHGRSLAAAVERVLSEPMHALPPTLVTSYAAINLESDKVQPAKEELMQMVANAQAYTDSALAIARTALERLNKGESLAETYPYPVQVWKVGGLPVVTLGGEPIVEYAIKMKQLFGKDAFVFGYANYIMAYISNPRVLHEGGYEGSSSPFRGAGWALNTESLIIQEVLKLAKQVGVSLAPKNMAIPGG